MIKNRYILLVLLIGVLCYSSCKDDYNEHYDRSSSLPDKNLYQMIKENSNLSKFSQLIDVAGYDSLLNSTQTFTVWAPINESLSDINPATIGKDQAKLIVGNHIARFNVSTSTVYSKLIQMLDNKIYSFSDGGNVFAGSKLIDHDILSKNGLLHTLESQIPYHYNLYEYIQATPSMSKLSAFVSSFEEERFNEELSTPIDIDESGRTVYDTVTTSYNRLFRGLLGLGYIDSEDSTYTMIMPSDKAWDIAYSKISSYFKTYNEDQEYADSIRNIQTSLAILEDLVYRGTINNPASLDSMVSTSPSVIYDPADLFSGTTRQTASNGLIYQTDDLRYNNTETWNKKIGVEGEAYDLRVAGPNTAVYTRTVTGEISIPVSNSQYIDVQATTPTSQPAVTFDIPDVLSGKYDIYVEFLPGSIDGAPRDSTRLLFELSYMNAKGDTEPILNNSNDLLTSGTEKRKMKVFSEFEFPVSNYYDRLWWVDYSDGLHSYDEYVITTKLMIKTNVQTSEFNNNILTRKFRIDRIIFEPVRN